MPYLDNLLASGEQPLRREHQHWFVIVADARYAIYAWIGAVVLLVLDNVVLSGSNLGGLQSIVGWIVLGLVVGGLLYFGWQVLQTEGVVNKRVVDSSLEKINDAILSQSVFGRIFGFGDLEILTASESGISRLRMLRQADDFKRTMLDAKHELELELSGARPMPSPAIRAAMPSQAPPQPGSAPPQTAMSADDVTRTLANLADLRDRGAISADDYEAKKADLLKRL